MANTDWFTLTNRGLRQAGQPEIRDRAFFSNAAKLTRYQAAMKEYIRFQHNAIFNDMPALFAERRITLNVDNVTGAIYPLDTGISAENITFNSFRNITPNYGAGTPIHYWDYENFSENVDVNVIASGRPSHWILLPVERTELSLVYKVRIYPTPDRAYNLEYIAQVNPYTLESDTSIVIVPPEYDHVLEAFARGSLEDILGEGKGGSIQAQAEQAFRKMRKKADRPIDQPKGVRMKTFFRSGRYGSSGSRYGYYDSPPDN